ncbi:GDSL-type esterase/lipase family protein [Gilvimarinus sp. SDUM040013]|uniref:GDSL-type esterase/lipase family protein n=1 Tax=Gilvimarinus gilvus TaxID=3058038 RepID=A0ABU4S2Y0_9GAMM|nr:GDSL-type esterase/lipase family protein [Gilvimarinus sp. SDUM040013]MDO3384937.1 GDSL-type esterase/lipase family protein [Gilvimarinus sp. SDUM040013]MDX6851530.1 GDSL-type esterase/lipase family protein [Gilvimarinus sp. SDUM040013]
MKIIAQSAIAITSLLASLVSAHSASDSAQNQLQLWPAVHEQTVNAHNHDDVQPWHGDVLNLGDERKTILSKNQNGDLVFEFENAWWSAFSINLKQPANLEKFRRGGLLLNLSVESFQEAGMDITWQCGPGCERKASATQQMGAFLGAGTQSLLVPSSCFIRDTDNAGYVKTPLRIGAGGTGKVAFSGIKWVDSLNEVKATVLECPNYKTVALEPAPLTEHWALSWWMPRHEVKVKLAQTTDPELVFIGDSITEGWENAGAGVFEKYFGQYETLTLGFGGDRTENVLWRLNHGEVDNIDPKLVVLMIGTNNTGHRQDSPALVAEGIKAILDKLQQKLPNTKVLLHAIFPRSATADNHLREINSLINARIRNFADGERVFFKDINSEFLTEDGVLTEKVMPDLLHPEEYGYSLWAEAIKDDIKRLVK